MFVVGLVLLAGCSEPPVPAPRPTVPAGKGVIVGRVTLNGAVPVMRELAPAGACHKGAPPVMDESVVVDEAGNFANVVVSIENAPNVDVPIGPVVVLDQVNCRFVPHVVAVRTAQALRAMSSDPTLHNVHGLASANPQFNLAMPSAGTQTDLLFSRPETPFTVKCDVHPWMTAHVAVFDHPLFAVTGSDGRFEIRNVPPGTYTLVAWQERYGTMKSPQVTVPPDATPEKPVESNIVVQAFQPARP